MSVAEEGGKIVTATVDAMRSVPLAIALLAVNAGFLGFSTFLFKEVSANAIERNKTQMELISTLVARITDKDCPPKT